MSDFSEAAALAAPAAPAAPAIPAAPGDASIGARAARLERFRREQLVVEYLNRGVSVAEIAARIGVGEKRMRAIIREILARRQPAPPEEFVAVQVSRLNEALLVAYSAMAERNLEAVDRVVKIVRELDRYHGFAAAGRRLPEPERIEARADSALTFCAALTCRAEFGAQDEDPREFAPESVEDPEVAERVEQGEARRKSGPTTEGTNERDVLVDLCAPGGDSRSSGSIPANPEGPDLRAGCAAGERPAARVQSTDPVLPPGSSPEASQDAPTRADASASENILRQARDEGREAASARSAGGERPGIPPQRLEKTQSAPGLTGPAAALERAAADPALRPLIGLGVRPARARFDGVAAS